MTLTTETPATRTSAPSVLGSHPSLGLAANAAITPVDPTRYLVSLDGEARGFVRATEDGWESLTGREWSSARVLGVRAGFVGAVRDLVMTASADARPERLAA